VVGVTVVLCGVYGVVAYTVRRREREIGIRIALGAAHQSVRALVFAQGVRYALTGLALGVPSALMVSRLMRGLLYDIAPHDPATITMLSAAVAAAIVAATAGPAYRAARIEPSAMMRSE
jgi:putative ABC transport system permease protein